MKDRSNDPSHHQRSFFSFFLFLKKINLLETNHIIHTRRHAQAGVKGYDCLLTGGFLKKREKKENKEVSSDLY